MSKELAIRVPAAVVSARIIRVVEKTVAALDLIITMRGGLKTFPGCTHWHLKRDRGRGTLEITWWPSRRRLWIKIQAGRTADWIDPMAPRLKREIQVRLWQHARRVKAKMPD
jgi:hypothetical protein